MGVKDSHELKQLETRREKLKAELSSRAAARAEAVKAYDATLCRLQAVEKSIAELSRKSETPVVTEHAMLRYLERVRGLDIQALHDEILSAARIETINTLKSCRLSLGNGSQLVVENRTVKTVVTDTPQGAGTNKAKPAVPRGPKPAQRRRENVEEAAFRD